MRPVLLIPGIYNSGPAHWHTLWQQRHPHVQRVEQADWAFPVCDTWVQALDAAVAAAPAAPILVAHSLGCLAAVHWAARRPRPVRAMLLVAVPDPAGPAFPADALGFAHLPAALPRVGPLAMMSSSSDPYSTPAFSARCEQAWGAEHLPLGALGHIHADSGLGDWPAGWAQVQRRQNA